MSKPPPEPSTRKTLVLPDRLWERIGEFRAERRRHEGRIPAEMEAIRLLIQCGLDADAEIARLRALLAAAGVDPDKREGGAP